MCKCWIDIKTENKIANFLSSSVVGNIGFCFDWSSFFIILYNTFQQHIFTTRYKKKAGILPACQTTRYKKKAGILPVRTCFWLDITLYIFNSCPVHVLAKESGLRFSNHYIFATWWYKPLIFQTLINWSNKNHSFEYLRSLTLGCKNIGLRKTELVTKT